MLTILFVLLNALILFSCYLVVHRTALKSSLSRQAIHLFVLYISQVTFTVLFLGVVVKSLGVLSLSILNALISLPVLWFLRSYIPGAARSLRRKLFTAAGEIIRGKDVFLYLFILLFMLQAGWLLVKIFNLPPFVHDAFTYHLHPVADWFQKGEIPLFTSTPVFRTNLNPMGPKLIHYWFTVFFGDLTLIELPQYLFGLFLVIAAYGIMRKLEVSRARAMRWATLIYFIPIILIESRTCQDHLVLYSLTLIAVFYLLDIFYKKDAPSPAPGAEDTEDAQKEEKIDPPETVEAVEPVKTFAAVDTVETPETPGQADLPPAVPAARTEDSPFEISDEFSDLETLPFPFQDDDDFEEVDPGGIPGESVQTGTRAPAGSNLVSVPDMLRLEEMEIPRSRFRVMAGKIFSFFAAFPGKIKKEGESGADLIFLSLALGLLIGVKQNSIKIFALLFFALLLSKGFSFTRVREFFKAHRWTLGIGLVNIILLGGFWFSRNSNLWVKYWKIFVAKFPVFLLVLLVLSPFFVYFSKRKFLKFFPSGNAAFRLRFAGPAKLAAIAGVTVLASVILLLSLYILPGTPFFSTFKSSIFSHKPLHQDIIESNSTFTLNLLSFPIHIKDSAAHYTADATNVSGFGVQFYTFGFLAFLLTLFPVLLKPRIRRSMRGYIFFFPLLLLCSYFIYYYSSFGYRLFMFFPVFALILAAVLMEQYCPPGRRRFLVLYLDILFLAMILFNGVACYYDGYTNPSRWKTLFTMDNSPNRTSIAYAPILEGKDWRFINDYLPPRARIAFHGGKDSWVFPYFDHRLKRTIYYLGHMPGFKLTKNPGGGFTFHLTGKLKNHLRKRRIHFLHFNPQGVVKHRRITRVKSAGGLYKLTKNLYYLKTNKKSKAPAGKPGRKKLKKGKNK